MNKFSPLLGAVALALACLSMSPATMAAPAASTHHHPKTHAAKIVVYTCPMHPEVRALKPGKCPKCGMTLVRRK